MDLKEEFKKSLNIKSVTLISDSVGFIVPLTCVIVSTVCYS